ncbi:hypothetical protein DPX16_14468 [Anabarilius grahami]|uniref:Uncharacterized protein n=1 Tax=Anabarilius grahami TaxID=495550 RepID=A0A3N0YXB6_ANAGA|nr:hypothetical protein DPX16_14468 [Anabarilius grahami]
MRAQFLRELFACTVSVFKQWLEEARDSAPLVSSQEEQENRLSTESSLITIKLWGRVLQASPVEFLPVEASIPPELSSDS